MNITSNRNLTLSTLLLVLPLVSCKFFGIHSESSVKLTNANLNLNIFPAVTQVQSAGVNANGPYVGTCTATFVSPTTMITAAHCLTEDAGGNVAKLQSPIYIHPLIPESEIKNGQEYGIQRDGTKQIIADKIDFHPGYLPRGGNDEALDVALVSFKPQEGLTKYYLPIRNDNGAKDQVRFSQESSNQNIANGDTSFQSGSIINYELKIIGFGKQDNADKDSGGDKGCGLTYVNKLEFDRINLKEGPTSNADAVSKGLVKGTFSQNSQGDSGGPVLDKENKLIGISSTVIHINATPGDINSTVVGLSGNYINVLFPKVYSWLKEMAPLSQSSDFGDDSDSTDPFDNLPTATTVKHEIVGLYQSEEVTGHNSGQLECVEGEVGSGVEGVATFVPSQSSTPDVNQSSNSTLPQSSDGLINNSALPRCFDQNNNPIVCPPGAF